MTMSSLPPPERSPELLDQLSAYIDGELDEQAQQQVEALIARDEATREELRRLERAWDLLDELPRAEARTDFTRSTVELIVVRELAVLEPPTSGVLSGRSHRGWGAWGVVLAAGVLGFAAVGAWWPHPDDALLRDLPVIEHLDAYRPIEDVEFLRRLQSAGLFSTEEARRVP